MKATEVTAGLAESNFSLLPGLWRDSLHVTCGLTACTPGSAPGPTLGNEYGKTFYLYTLTVASVSSPAYRALCVDAPVAIRVHPLPALRACHPSNTRRVRRIIAKFHYTGPTGPARTFLRPYARVSEKLRWSVRVSDKVRSGPCSGI